MSTIKSSDEHLTLNADGSGKDIKFQANGVEKASISSSGAFTSTSINTGTIEADDKVTISYEAGSSDWELESTSGDDFTISRNSQQRLLIDGSTGSVGIGVVPSNWPSNGDHRALQIGTGGAIYGRGSGDEARAGLTANAYLDATDDRYEYIANNYATHYRQSDGNHSFWTAPSGSANGAITFTNRLEIKEDGRGLSQFTAKAWILFDGRGTVAITDSHNVSSVTDNGTGSYLINLSNACANSNYAVVCVCDAWSWDSYASTTAGSKNSSRFQIMTSRSSATGREDNNHISALVFGD